MAVIQIKRGTAAQWAAVNPVLALAELGLEVDTNKLKAGDGVSVWNDLDYLTGDSVPSGDGGNSNNNGIALTDLSVIKPNPLPSGSGDVTYNSTSGEFTYTPPEQFSGSYDDLTNTPNIPTVPTDVSAFNNDVGYLTTESDTLDNVTGRGNTTSNDITAGGDGSTSGVTISDGNVQIRSGDGDVASIDLYCEVNNAHKVSIKAPAHSDFAGDVNFVLPPTEGTAGQVLSSDGTGTTSWIDATVDDNSGNVDPPPIITTNIELSPSVMNGTVGGEQQLLVTYTPQFATDTKVSFSSSKPQFAAVDENGLVTFVAPGSSLIVATLDSDTSVTSSSMANVSAQVIEATAINLSGPSTLTEGNTGQLTVAFTPTNTTTRDINYSSDDASVEVNSVGVITAKSAGSATITATGYNNITDTLDVTVLSSGVDVESLFVDTIQGVLGTMSVGEDYTLIYGISPQNATNKSCTLQILDENGNDITNGGLTQQPSELNGEAGGKIDFQLLDGAIGQDRIINVISVDQPGLVAPYSYPIEVFGAGLAPQEDNYLPMEVPTAGQTFDIHIMIGQSNMMGRGDFKKVTTSPPQGTSYTWNFGEDGLRPTTNSFTHNADSSNAGFITGYAKSLYQNSSIGRKVIICPAARGNTSLPEWLPGTDLYNGIISTFTSLKAYMETNNLIMGNICINMHQGESDMHGNGAKGNGIVYLNNLHQIRWALQEDFPELNEFIIHRVGIDAPANYENSKYFRIMQAQHAAAYLSPDLFKLGYLACASFYGTSDQNDVHYTQEGYNRWGDEAGGYVIDGLENDNWLDPNDISQDPSYQFVAGANIDVFITSANNTIISKNLENPENYIVPSQGSLGQLSASIPLTTPINQDWSQDSSFFMSISGYDTNSGNSIKLINDNSGALDGAFNWIDVAVKTFVSGTSGPKWQIPMNSAVSMKPLAFSVEANGSSGKQSVYLANIDSNVADIPEFGSNTQSVNDTVTYTHLFDPNYYPVSKTVRQVVSYGWCSSGFINKQYATILNANISGSGSAGNSDNFFYRFDNDIQNYGDCEMLSGLEGAQYTAQGSLVRSSIVAPTNSTLRFADDVDYQVGVQFEILSPYSTDANGGQSAYSEIIQTSGLGDDPFGVFWLAKGFYNAPPYSFVYRNQGNSGGNPNFKYFVNMGTLMDTVGSIVNVIWRWHGAERKMELWVDGSKKGTGYITLPATLNFQFLRNSFYVRDFANAACAYKAQRLSLGHPKLATFFDIPTTRKAPYDTSIELGDYIARSVRSINAMDISF